MRYANAVSASEKKWAAERDLDTLLEAKIAEYFLMAFGSPTPTTVCAMINSPRKLFKIFRGTHALRIKTC